MHELDAAFFASISKDYHRFAGNPASDIAYYVLLPGKYNPLYRESTKPSYRGGYRFETALLFEESDNKDSDVDDAGMVETEYDATTSISCSLWEEKVVGASEPGPIKPKEGDVICYHPETNQARWFIVLKVKESGVVYGGPTFTEWAIDLKERSSLSGEIDVSGQ